MARIYVGRSTGIGSFERHVVLKMILPERANDHIAVQMFLDEARLAASLNHQNVAQVFEVDEDAGIHFLAMEYVHGQDLRALLAKAGSTGTRVPLELALTVVAGAAAGLHHAHERRSADGVPMGIVHRDVSPSNIMIGYDGAVKLLDFGIAKATLRSVETQSGIIKGKFAYMAPEQCRGRDVDRRSDVFSLGIILYEVTTQHRCFRADSDFDTMHRIVTGDIVRPTRLVQGYPAPLEAIVMKALALDATQRYQSAGELLEAIEGFSVASRMSLSTMSLGRFMREMFGEVPEPWLVSGRINQPLQAREQTISNTNASGEQVARPGSSPSSPSLHEQAPMHLPPEPGFEGPSRRDGSQSDHERVRPYAMPGPMPAPMPSPMLPAFVPGHPPPGAHAAQRAPMGTQPLPPPQFGMQPGSGSGPSHSAIVMAGPPGVANRQSYHSVPGMPGMAGMPGLGGAGGSHSDISYPRYEAPDADTNLQPNSRLVYIGLGMALVGIIVLLAIAIADDEPDETPAQQARPSSGAVESSRTPDPAGRESGEPGPRPLSSEPANAAPANAGAAGTAAPAFEQITIHVESTPSGADVLLSGNVIGTTPLTIRRARGTGVATLTIHRARYQDVKTNIDLSSDYSKDVMLEAIVDEKTVPPAGSAASPAGAAGAAGANAAGPNAAGTASPGSSTAGKPAHTEDAPRPAPVRDPKSPARDRGEHGSRSDRSERTTPHDTKPTQECQPPGRYNPFDKNCNGQPCPMCKESASP
jgi:serine/threonine protein kinase